MRRPPSQGLSCHLLMAAPHGCRWARVHDVSTAGVGLVVNHRLEPGALLMVELRNARQAMRLVQVARVVHCSHQADGGWLTGCAFVEEVGKAELDALLE